MTKLEEITPEKRGEDYRKVMHEHVDMICDNLGDDMAGFILAGWDMEMSASSSYRIYKGAPFGLRFIPCFIQELFRSHAARDEAEDVLTERFGG